MDFRKLIPLVLLASATSPAFAGSGEPIYTPTQPINPMFISVDRVNAGIERNANRYSLSMMHQTRGSIAANFDLATDSMYVAKGTQVQAFTFTQVATAMHPNNSALQQQAIEAFRQLASDRSGVLSYQSRSFRESEPWNPLPSDCDLSPCTPAWYNGYGSSIRIDLRPPPNTGPDLSGWPPEIIAIDRANFERARDDACDDQTDAALNARLGMGAALASCGTAEFGLPAIACGASIGTVGVNLRTMSRKGKTCNSRYPGPGKW